MDPVVSDQDLMKAQFQEELNRWFESRGILADMRSHLRHLMISALQNTQLGLKPNDRTSPKSQALNLLVAEYMLRHKNYYTLSVFTSEVPTLINFSCVNPNTVLRGKGHGDLYKKKPIQRYSFQDNELEDIFNAMGLSTCAEELERTKACYLDKNNDSSLLELLLQTILEVSTKLQIRKSLESCEVEEGKKLLSKKWSSRVADILLSEKIKPFQISTIEEAIFRITENELKRILHEERRTQTRLLLEREKRIQDYLKRHEGDIFEKLKDAEKDFANRTRIIEEELSERQKELYILAMEWNDKHEEVVKISKNYSVMEKENKKLKVGMEELKIENSKLKDIEEKQKKEIDELKEEMDCLIKKLKETSESNGILKEQVEVLIRGENKEVSINHDLSKQPDIFEECEPKVSVVPPKNNQIGDLKTDVARLEKEDAQSFAIMEDTSLKNNSTESQQQSTTAPTEIRKTGLIKNGIFSDNEIEYAFTSSSFSTEEVLLNVYKKLELLEEESNKINQKYLEYKSKYRSVESDSETSKTSLHSIERPIQNPEIPLIIRETKFSQTDLQKTFEMVQTEEKPKTDFEIPVSLKNSKLTPDKILPIIQMREPTKRQLLNREYFLKSRELFQEFQKQSVENQITPPSKSDSSSPNLTSSSSDEVEKSGSKHSKKSALQKAQEELVMLTPLRTTSFYCNELPKVEKHDSAESVRKSDRNSFRKEDMQCLALLEKTRIKSPKEGVSKPILSMRQQMLLSEESEEEKSAVSVQNSSKSGSSGRVSVGQDNSNDGFW